MARELRRLVLLGLLSLTAWFGGALPASAEPVGPTLVIALHARLADRPALRAALLNSQVPLLKRWRKEGLVTGYRLLFTRYPDSGVWDAMEILTFRDSAALARWRAGPGSAPGGLGAQSLPLVQAIETTPTKLARSSGTSKASSPAVLVIPYASLVSTPEYLKYVDGYSIPQFGGWIGDGDLASFDILLAEYPAARDWNALIVLNYKDDAALAHREEEVTSTRARLVLDPAWKAISDNKKAIRNEGVIAIADQIASSELP